MATLYVDVPDELYEALRSLAREQRRFIAAEVLTLLEENIPAAANLARRKELFLATTRLRSRRSPATEPFPSAEEMQRYDRLR